MSSDWSAGRVCSDWPTSLEKVIHLTLLDQGWKKNASVGHDDLLFKIRWSDFVLCYFSEMCHAQTVLHTKDIAQL